VNVDILNTNVSVVEKGRFVLCVINQNSSWLKGGKTKMGKKRKCNGCDVTTYTIDKEFTCAKCGWKTIIEKDDKGNDVQIN